MKPNREQARQLAREYRARGDALGWFEQLYRLAEGDPSVIPWADLGPNPNLTGWVERRKPASDGKAALVIGCGLGDDAEALARLGFRVTAFDVSPTAIQWARRRFPSSPVDYEVADLFNPPAEWKGRFDFVLEAYTLQSLPAALRTTAIDRIAELVRPGGTVLVICRGRDNAEPPSDQIPSPLSRADLARFAQHGLSEAAFEDYVENEDPPVRRFRAEYRG